MRRGNKRREMEEARRKEKENSLVRGNMPVFTSLASTSWIPGLTRWLLHAWSGTLGTHTLLIASSYLGVIGTHALLPQRS